ncbi:EI24 domain-containing protein [Demequina oxidasica]|uniref:EI24 domain-containing protein n=1 Tax=Demequina oxidasica TaxID=676199 RepID=UPI0007833F46|nr:EI24 domain-containing protein [Demequina oxidasica]
MTATVGRTRRLLARSGASGFLLGASYVWRGFRTWSANPRLMGWGLLPGVIAFLLVASVVVAVAFRADDAASWILARAAAGITGPIATVLSVLLAIAIFGGTLVAALYTFTALTLFIGQPFFERISRHLDSELGEPAVIDAEPWWRSTLRGLAEAVRLLALTGVLAIGLFLVSLIPVAGSVASFILGAILGGWFLSLELTAYALSRRGVVTLRQRRRQLASQRAVSVGFGTTVFLLFLLPFGAIATMPAANAGATLLSRRLMGEVGAPSEQARAKKLEQASHARQLTDAEDYSAS